MHGLALAFVLLAPLFAAEAQPAQKVPRIGVVAPLSPPPPPNPDIEGFRQGLRELGYVEGQTIIVVTVAGKPSLDVPPGTLNAILKQAGLKKEK